MGEGFLIASMLLCVTHFIKPLKKNIGIILFMLIAASFAMFLIAHIMDDFSMLNVVLHSHKDKPFLYKIAGTWASHEGSMLFWCVLLAGYAAFAKVFEKDKIVWRTQELLFTLLLFGFLLFTYITNPFTRLAMPLHQGMDLNPVLQDISLVIHPPHLYLGTVGFAVPFIQSLSFLRHHVSAETAVNTLKPTLLLAFFFQTVGIILGSFWAYYELGWGGWWFFDPVENLALMPWLMALITLHLLLLMRGNKSLYGWVMLGCIKTFLMCLLALTLIRAGMLNSVHAFGSDPQKGFLLGTLFIFWSTLSIFFYFRFYKTLSIHLSFKKPTLENLTFTGMGFISLALLGLSIGTLLPVISDALGGSLVVRIHYFIQTFAVTFLGAGICFIGVLWILTRKSFKAWIGDLKTIQKHLAHLGVVLAGAGIIYSGLYSTEKEFLLSEKDSLTFAGYFLTLDRFDMIDGPNYKAVRATVDISGKKAYPEERFYHTQNVLHRETSMLTFGLSQLHLTMGDAGLGQKSGKAQCTLKVIYKPGILVMWAGFMLMVLGILWSLINAMGRRFLQ